MNPMSYLLSREFKRVTISLILAGCMGCQPATSDPAMSNSESQRLQQSKQALSAPRGDAKLRLRDIFRRYQVCSYYSDQGQVTLSQQSEPNSGNSDGVNIVSAPLSVKLTARSLQVNAYAARVRVNVASTRQQVDEIQLEAWFDEPETSNFDSQVLNTNWVSPANNRLRIERLFADTVLRSRLSAGSAGPPPQLEWLLADQPMSKLFETGSDSLDTFRWLENSAIGRDQLHRIEVVSERDRFVFWIEPATSLIRRVELPLPPELQQSGTDWQLTVELNDASFQPRQANTKEEEKKFANTPTFTPVRVNAFVPIPPPPPSQLIGRAIEDRLFKTRVARDRFRLIATVNDAPDRHDAALHFWAMAIPVLAKSCDIQLICDDSSFTKRLREFPSPPVTVSDTGESTSLIRKLRLLPSSVALLDAENRVLMTESSISSVSVDQALGIVRDEQSGVDVASKIQQNYEMLLREYRDQIKRHRL